MREHPILQSKKNKIEVLKIGLKLSIISAALNGIFNLLLVCILFLNAGVLNAIDGFTLKSISDTSLQLKKLEPGQKTTFSNELYTTELVQISAPGADLILHGSLTIPTNKKQFPAVLLINDNGPQTRNNDLHGIAVFEILADFFGRNGIAVLRYDKRGVGSSSGSFDDATIQDFATDANAALLWLKQKLGSRSNKVGILGHGEGTYAASLTCKLGGNPDFMIWMGGSPLRGDKALLEQNAKLLKASGIQDSTVNKFVDLVHIFSQIIRFEKDNNLALDQINHSIQNQSIVFTAKEKSVLPLSKLELMALATQMTSPWIRSFLSFNPLKHMKECKIPFLALFAEKDHETPLKNNIEKLRSFANESNYDRIVIKELTDHNHLFQKCKSGTIEEYKQIDSGMSPEVLNILSNWIKAQ
jgi:alpha/beta superfamily hydrolase